MELNGNKSAMGAVVKILERLGGGSAVQSAKPKLDAPHFMRSRDRKKKSANETAASVAPMPLSPRMAQLRNLAEELHAHWATGDNSIADENLNSASRGDLGILCGLLVDCAHPFERRALVNWLEANLSEQQFKIIPHRATGGQPGDGKFFSTSARSWARGIASDSNRKALACTGGEALRISVRIIDLGEDASQLLMDWIEGDRAEVQEYLGQVSRVDLAILCSLMNERAHPLRRPEFMNWLEANIGEEPRSERSAAFERATR